jgi:hypothetical protein
MEWFAIGVYRYIARLVLSYKDIHMLNARRGLRQGGMGHTKKQGQQPASG